MPWEPDAATLAIFGTAASLLGILITNQAKVSEFRQKWIDALRDDASTLIANTLVIHAAKAGDNVDESLTQIYQTTARIRLRLNPDEPQTIAVINAMNYMRDANHTKVPTEFSELNLRIGAFTDMVQIVLKREWKRVKFGEPLYRWTFAAIAVAMLVTVGVVLKNTFPEEKMGDGFNSSVWNAFVVLSPFGVGMFVFIIVKFWRYKGWHHLFDPKHNDDPRLMSEGGDFSPHWNHYEGLAKLAITLSAGALAFLINAISNEKPPASQFGQRLTDAAPIVVGFFGASILLLILFLLWMAYCYEDYCHTASHDSYKAWKYAVTFSLGVMGFISFVCGFGWLGVNLFRRG